MNFFNHGATDIQANWNLNNKISPFLLDVAVRITNYFGAASTIIFIFINYKCKKRRILISIIYAISGITWIIYIAINDNNIWLSIVLRAFNGFLLGFFQSSHISYMMHFSQEKLHGFHSSLIEVSITLGISLLNLLFYTFHWKIVAILLSIQSFVFMGLIWLVPEVIVIPKSFSRQYIHKHPFLRNFLVMISIMALQCFSGIGFMIDNCSRLLGDIGVNLNGYLQLALVNFISCVSAFIGCFIVDAIGVASMWAFSSFGISLSLFAYAATLSIVCPKWLGVLSVFLYFLFFGFGEGTIPWMFPGIAFPESVMVEGGGINAFVNQFMGIWFGYLQNEMIKKLGEFGSVLFSAIVSFAALFFGLFMIPNIRKHQSESLTVF